MKRLIALTAAAALSAATLSAVAAPVMASEAPPAAAPVQEADHAEREALVRRFFVAIQFEKMMNSMMESMWGPLIEGNEAIPEDKRELVQAAATAAFEIVLPQMTEANVEMYVETFSVQELRELVAFYESPTGRSLMAKTVMLGQRSGEMVERFTPVMEEEMRRQLCLRMDCSNVPDPTAAPAKGRRG